jgi:alkyl sulfatase BDS1-like metallo-beta-lactamase superfamily hydrolase
MRTIELPPHLRVGQGYGKVPWAVRTIWETYVGWFKLESTSELYPDEHAEAQRMLVETVGVDVALGLATTALGAGQAVVAILLAQSVAALDPDHPGAARVVAQAHQHLLDRGGDVNFWESGWLESEMQRWAARAEGTST